MVRTTTTDRHDRSTAGRRLWALAALSAFLLTVLPSATAHAHAVLLAAQPERGATVTGPVDRVRLEFSEPVLFPQVQVRGPDGARVESGLPEELGTGVEQPLTALEPGTYEVAYRVTSDDGHPIEGSFEFAYEPAPGTAEPEGGVAEPGDEGSPVAEEAAPTRGAAGDDSDPEPRAEAGEAATDADEPARTTDPWPVLLGGLLLLALFVAGAAVALHRRRDTDDTGEGSRSEDPVDAGQQR